MELSENFSLEELCRTETGVVNQPGEKELEKLLYLATYILQPIRNKFGEITVTSGYRSPAVQAALTAQGRPTSNTISQHTQGEAADIVSDKFDLQLVFDWIRVYLPFGQVIIEEWHGKRWVHVSLPRIAKQNQQALVYDGSGYRNA